MKRCSGALLMNGNSAKIQEREKKQKLNCKKNPPTGLHSLFAHPRVCALFSPVGGFFYIRILGKHLCKCLDNVALLAL